MLIINTIKEFSDLSITYQQEILRSIRAKDQLDAFLTKLSNPNKEEPHWVSCVSCEAGKCKRCHPDHPGWKWLEPEVRDNSDIHPSQIDKCLKYLVLCCSGYAEYHEEKIDPRLRRIFDIGTAWHNTMQTYGRNGAFCDPKHYHPEAVIDPDAVTFDGQPVLPIASANWIRGSADALIDRAELWTPSLGSVGIKLIHEYKTINSNGYEKLIRPQPKHKQQATIYSAVFDAPIVIYMYLNKDNSHMADFPVPFDFTIWNDIVTKIKKVQHYTNAEQPVPWEETAAIQQPMECSSCGLRGVCNPPTLRRVA